MFSVLAKRLLIAALFLPAAATAEPVRLTSITTGFVVSGELIRFDGQDYVIRSSIGQLTIDGYDTPVELVAAMTITPAFESKPSISTSRAFNVCSRSS